MKDNILGIELEQVSKLNILEKIKKNTSGRGKFIHIVSLNPEILVLTTENPEFKKAVESAQIKIIDGVGVVAAAAILGIRADARITGVDLMRELLEVAFESRLRVVLIGGRPKVAEQVVECQKALYPGINIIGFEGIKSIKNPQKNEEAGIFSIVADTKPHLVFFAFGSPDQELWIARHKLKLAGCVCIGVGGAFDYLAERVARAPKIVRQIGLEWLFRLIIQPWRIKRQLRLIKFIYLILQQRLLGKTY